MVGAALGVLLEADAGGQDQTDGSDPEHPQCRPDADADGDVEPAGTVVADNDCQ